MSTPSLTITNRHDSACRTITIFGEDLGAVLREAARVAERELQNPWAVHVDYDDHDGQWTALLLDNRDANTARRARDVFDGTTGGAS